jgi:branched-chain amino acid transport system permease protein
LDYWYGILAQLGIYVILALALNVIVGMTGLLQLGHAGFFALGAYAAALTAMYATFPALGPFNLALSLAAAVAVSALFALVVGLPCLRLRGDYLAIATLAFGEMTRMVLSAVEFPGCELTDGQSFGGATGINLPSPQQYAIDYTTGYATYPVILAAVVLTYAFMLNLKRSYVGRAMICIREDEVAAKSMGIHAPRYKMLAFVLSAVFAGVAGALFAHNPYTGMRVSPDEFGLLRTVEILLIVVLGGLGSVNGSVLAAAILVFIPELLRFIPEMNVPLIGPVKLAEHRQLLYAILLIVIIRLAPNGILGLNESPAFLRRLFARRARA